MSSDNPIQKVKSIDATDVLKSRKPSVSNGLSYHECTEVKRKLTTANTAEDRAEILYVDRMTEEELQQMKESLTKESLTKETLKHLAETIHSWRTDYFSSLFENLRHPLKIFAKAIEDANKDLLAFRRKQIEYRYEKLWNDLEEEFKTKNRYFPDPKKIKGILNPLNLALNLAKVEIPVGVNLFRARKIKREQLSNESKKMLETSEKNQIEYEIKNPSEQKRNLLDYIGEIFSSQLTNFWGFDKKYSDAPYENASSGRANPIGISYLYACREESTTIAEVQPAAGELVSVAKIEILKPLLVFNFDFLKDSSLLESQQQADDSNEDLFETELNFLETEVFFRTLSKLFSKPAAGNPENYYLTQYLCEFIKNLDADDEGGKFDGIQFNSSLEEDGVNVVLFDTSKKANGHPKNYKIINSSVHEVKRIKVESNQLLPPQVRGS